MIMSHIQQRQHKTQIFIPMIANDGQVDRLRSQSEREVIGVYAESVFWMEAHERLILFQRRRFQRVKGLLHSGRP